MNKEMNQTLKIETLNALFLKFGKEALREALLFFMPLHAVLKAVPITRYSRCTGAWTSIHKVRDYDIVKKYLHRISLKTLEELVSRTH